MATDFLVSEANIGSTLFRERQVEMNVLALLRNKIVDPWIKLIVFGCAPGGIGYRSSHILRVANLTPGLRRYENYLVWYNIIVAMVTSTLHLGHEVTMTFITATFVVELRVGALDIPNSAPLNLKLKAPSLW